MNSWKATENGLARIDASFCSHTLGIYGHYNNKWWCEREVFQMLYRYRYSTSYSLCQKKRTFNSKFFRGPPGLGGPKIHIVDYVNGGFWPPSSRGATKKFGIKCAFLLTPLYLIYKTNKTAADFSAWSVCFPETVWLSQGWKTRGIRNKVKITSQ